MHLFISFAVLALLLWIIFKSLSSFTHHGELIDVPDFGGIKIAELNNFVADKNVRFTIIDSVFDPKGPKGVVIRQDPEKNIKVKHNRTIYLYVSTVTPPQVTMPKLKDRSLRQAVAMLETYGLKFGKPRYKPDQCSNCVLQQLIKGKPVEAGTQVPKGTVVDLVVGKGLSNEKVAVPNLIGLTREQAIEKLVEYSLNEGSLTFEQPADSLRARVYRQIPGPTKEEAISMGSSIDLFLSNKKEKFSTNDSTNIK